MRVVFAGGGTGGHLFPALAIADEIMQMRPETECTFVGTRGKIEARVVPARGYGFTAIWISGFSRKLSLQTLLFPLKLIVAFVQSLRLLLRLKPAAVVGTGGYVSGPVVLAASLLGIPTLLQEQNSVPGATTRLLATRASAVHVSFQESLPYLKRRDNVQLTGNPTRSAIGTGSREEAARAFTLDPRRKTLLVFGGSLGARHINDAVLKSVADFVTEGAQVIWQTGEGDYAGVDAAVGAMGADLRGAIRPLKFIERMEMAYAASDVAVCRAGATTLAELTRAGLPSVLVPYPFAAGDHQTRNAMAMVEAGAAVMIADKDLAASLHGAVAGLLNDPARRKEMSARARALARPDAARVLAAAVLELAKTSSASHG